MGVRDNLQGVDEGQLSDTRKTANTLNGWLRAMRDVASVAVDVVLTTRGDLLTRSASAVTRLAVGAVNTVLRSDGTDPNWGKVGTNYIDDDAITLGKMASGTAGNLITYSAAGDPAAVATGTATHVLTSNGAGAAPTFQASTIGDISALTTDDVLDGSADFVPYRDTGEGANNKATLRRFSALAFLEQQAASASAQIDFALDGYTEYRDFLLVIDDVVPATDTASFRLRVSTDGGSTFDSTAGNYAYNGVGQTSAAITNTDNAATFIQLNSASATLGNAANEHFSCELFIYNPASTGANPRFQWDVVQYNSAAHITVMEGCGQRLADQDTTDIRLFMSAGNITSGTFTLYGVRG